MLSTSRISLSLLGATTLMALAGLTTSARAQFVYVSDQNAGNVYRFTGNGARTTFATGLNNPEGLARDSSGNIYVADTGSGHVYKYTPGGVQSTFVTFPSLGAPDGLAFDSSGNLFVSDQGGNIYKFSPGYVNGSLLPSPFATGLFTPEGIAIDSSNNLYVSTFQDIVKFTPGGVESTFAHNIIFPDNLAFDHSGNLFAAVNEHTEIFKFAPGYLDSDPLPSPYANTMYEPQGLAFDLFGDLLNAAASNGQIDVFAPGFVNGDTPYVFASGMDRPSGVLVTGEFRVQFQSASTPEPGAFALLAGIGLSGTALMWKRRRRSRTA